MLEDKQERAERSEAVARRFKEEGKAAKGKAKPKRAMKSKTNVVVVPAPVKMTEEQANKKLGPIANEINVRFEKIAKLDGQADDHRLAAALRLEEAKKICGASGVRFRTWAEENVKDQSWETVRKLAAVGGAPNPALALEDMRKKNRLANEVMRKRQKTKDLEAKFLGGQGAAVADVLEKAKPEEALKAVKKFATNVGMTLMSDTDAKTLKQAAKSAEMVKGQPMALDALKEAFLALPARDKMAFVSFAASEVGGQFVSALDQLTMSPGAAEDDPLAIPPELRRTRKTA